MGRGEHTRRDGVYQIGPTKKRRAFLRWLAVSGGGAAGIRLATKKAFGESPSGVPLVWRRDVYGNPETIRFIPKERKRRLNVYDSLDVSYFQNKSKSVNGFTVVESSTDSVGLEIKVYVDDVNDHVRRSLPDTIKGIPIVLEERERNSQSLACSKFVTNYFDALPANPRVEGK